MLFSALNNIQATICAFWLPGNMSINPETMQLYHYLKVQNGEIEKGDKTSKSHCNSCRIFFFFFLAIQPWSFNYNLQLLFLELDIVARW